MSVRLTSLQQLTIFGFHPEVEKRFEKETGEVSQTWLTFPISQLAFFCDFVCMASEQELKLPLSLWVDKERNRVVVAEANGD
ncbi:hypothetical protein JHK87_001318 [Glycine soja]|nr:hypothetical protein JHK87_001318 [Glycine soja]